LRYFFLAVRVGVAFLAGAVLLLLVGLLVDLPVGLPVGLLAETGGTALAAGLPLGGRPCVAGALVTVWVAEGFADAGLL
jgi:hypothetical protein